MPAESPSDNPYAEDDLLVRADAAAARSCAEQDNPYAAPDVHLSELDENSLLSRTANADGLIDAWRDGDLLVVSEPGRLPEYCLQCGRTAERMETLQFVPIKPQQADGGWVVGSLCPVCFSLHRWGEIDHAIGSCGFIIVPLACFIVIPYFLFLMIWRNFFPAGMFWAAVGTGSLSLIISIELLQRARQRMATLSENSVSGDKHWLRGAKAPFLARLPLFPRK